MHVHVIECYCYTCVRHGINCMCPRWNAMYTTECNAYVCHGKNVMHVHTMGWRLPTELHQAGFRLPASTAHPEHPICPWHIYHGDNVTGGMRGHYSHVHAIPHLCAWHTLFLGAVNKLFACVYNTLFVCIGNTSIHMYRKHTSHTGISIRHSIHQKGGDTVRLTQFA